MIEVFDNFLEPNQFRNLQAEFLSDNMKWTYGPVIADSNNLPFLGNITGEPGREYNFQFCNALYNRCEPISEDFYLISPLLDAINIAALIRVKANLNTRTSKIIEHGYHIDQNFAHALSGIFYLNTCDGYTAFEESGRRVESVANRMLIFDNTLMHTGTTTTNCDRRVVININFFPALDKVGTSINYTQQTVAHNIVV